MAARREQLAAQLKTAANQLGDMDGIDLALAITDVCSALLSIAADEADGADKLGGEDLLDLASGYQGVAKKVDTFAASLPVADSGDLTGDLEAKLTEAMKSIQASEALLSSLTKQLASSEQRTDELDVEFSEIGKTLEDIEAAVGRLEDTLGLRTGTGQDGEQGGDLEMRAQGICNRLEAVTERKEELDSELTKIKSRWETLDGEIATIQENKEKVQSKIDAVPQRKHDLLKQYRELSDELTELREAEQNCNEEKQAELRRRIEELAPEVDQLKTDTETLDKRIQELGASKTKYDAKKETLSTNVVQAMETAIKQVAPIISNHKERLEQIKRTADELERNLAACERMRRGLHSWYESQRTPLEAMEDVIRRESPDDVPRLLETLDPSTLERVQTLRSQVEETLGSLDEILGACVRASTYDADALLKKVY